MAPTGRSRDRKKSWRISDRLFGTALPVPRGIMAVDAHEDMWKV